MKDETWVASEEQFVINVVLPTLVEVKGLSRTSLQCVRTCIDGGFHDIGIDLIAIDQLVVMMLYGRWSLPSSLYHQRSRAFLWCYRLSEEGWSCLHFKLLSPPREFENAGTSF
jgi:hypothetical protein